MRPHSRDLGGGGRRRDRKSHRAVPDAAHDRRGRHRAQRGARARARRDASPLLSGPDGAGERTGARRRRVGPRRPDRAQLRRGRPARGVRDPRSRPPRSRTRRSIWPAHDGRLRGAQGGTVRPRARHPAAARDRGASADADRSGGRPGAARRRGSTPRSHISALAWCAASTSTSRLPSCARTAARSPSPGRARRKRALGLRDRCTGRSAPRRRQPSERARRRGRQR